MVSVILTIGSVAATASVAIFTRRMAGYTYLSIIQSRREAIERVIACAIRKETASLFNLKSELKEIIKEEAIKELGKICFSSQSEPCWIDFSRNDPELGDRIWRVVEEIKNYQLERKECIKKIKKELENF